MLLALLSSLWYFFYSPLHQIGKGFVKIKNMASYIPWNQSFDLINKMEGNAFVLHLFAQNPGHDEVSGTEFVPKLDN